jgi:hypothetical protein
MLLSMRCAGFPCPSSRQAAVSQIQPLGDGADRVTRLRRSHSAAAQELLATAGSTAAARPASWKTEDPAAQHLPVGHLDDDLLPRSPLPVQLVHDGPACATRGGDSTP